MLNYFCFIWYSALISGKGLQIHTDQSELGLDRLNPYWQILENSSRKFSKISVFRGVTQTDFWKTHPVFFRNFNFRGHIWMCFPDIGLAHTPEIFQ